MSGQADDKLYVRGLLAEAGIEESPELVAALLALRSESHGKAPETTGELGGLLAGTPVPLARKSKRTRGIILSAALVGAMAAGATGVAANPDFLIRADPLPSVTFTPQDVPTVEKAAQEPEAESAAEAQVPAAPLPEPTVPPVAEDAPAAEAPEEEVTAPVPAPAAAPEPAPAPVPAPGRPGAPGTGPGNGKVAVPGPQTGHIPGHNRGSGGGLRDTMGSGVPNTKNRAVVPEKGRGQSSQEHGRNDQFHPGQGQSYPGHGGPGRDR
ncbi:hypothetical protein MUK71_00930 [Arthrobacter zhangbolii]|uniref:Uncharacterized protein n=1 Tax=Arthrobacter zhangbolii TaxID=2886936 RepID=A0A9X1MC92_9MICC|nr:hypothetical protein [Arthrobacter zhangbolii]MCC3274219.1 hypothetical protein [Arthrobacter zhangbolii]UON92256.1 hypothetical protein MUK71_00930 [Arthrobacter zhangbolii]